MPTACAYLGLYYNDAVHPQDPYRRSRHRGLERPGTPTADRLAVLRTSADQPGQTGHDRSSGRPRRPNALAVIKDPYVLEFLDLPEDHRLNETELKERLISHLQAFLLELGHGFAFVGRRQRLTLDGDHFYADLVFYHVRLKCYVIIDLKTQKLTHADLGQMQLYVNYYDREVKGPDDNPTLGLILCTNENEAVVRYILGEGQEQIFASRYRMVLPTEEELAAEVRREMAALGFDDSPVAAPAATSSEKSEHAASQITAQQRENETPLAGNLDGVASDPVM